MMVLSEGLQLIAQGIRDATQRGVTEPQMMARVIGDLLYREGLQVSRRRHMGDARRQIIDRAIQLRAEEGLPLKVVAERLKMSAPRLSMLIHMRCRERNIPPPPSVRWLPRE